MADAASHSRVLRLGTRGSQLARWQAEWVATELRKFGHSVELIEIATRGDVNQTRPIEEIGTQGIFTKTIQQALLAGDIDLAVHSLKDLPTEPVEGLVLAAVSERESPADVLVLLGGRGARCEVRGDALAQLAPGARVGTGSLRRQAQLRHARPDLCVSEVRGNVDTRLRKLDEGQFDAIVLAEAGLRRLGLDARIQHILPFDLMLPAVGQGALGIECREDDDNTLSALVPLDHKATHAAILAERSLLHHLRGGCMAPIGALASIDAEYLELQAVVLSTDGFQRLAMSGRTQPTAYGLTVIENATRLGQSVADWLIENGASKLIADSRNSGDE